jgi:hypothetical protein
MIARGKRVSAPPLDKHGEKNPTPEGSHTQRRRCDPSGVETFSFIYPGAALRLPPAIMCIPSGDDYSSTRTLLRPKAINRPGMLRTPGILSRRRMTSGSLKVWPARSAAAMTRFWMMV